MNRSLKIEGGQQGAHQSTVVRPSERCIAGNDNPGAPYEPSPLDTSAVALDEQILVLTELLAKHTHDVWAQQRLAEGWRHGPTRNDARKEHPNLVPYEELSHEEQEYDRRTSLQTLQAIIALGYRIQKT